MERANLTTLRARREARELVLAGKCSVSEIFVSWFPLQEHSRNTRGQLLVQEKFAQ